MLSQTNNKIQGVIAANDNIAGAVIADEKAKHLKPIPLSGQDASVQGVQYILAGWQSGTVYKKVSLEANAAAAAAIALLHGKKPTSNGFRQNGKKKEPTLTLPVTWITKKNYKTLFRRSGSRRATCASGRTRSTASRFVHCETVEASTPGASTASPRPERSSMSDTPLLQLQNITKTFGSVQALDDVDFEVEPAR